MSRIVKGLLFTFALSILCAGFVRAQTTHNAASCNVGDVQSAVNSASSGDTVMVPAGTCIWTSGLSVSSGISIIGAGEGSTVIESDVPTETFLSVSLPPSGSLFQFSSMTLEPASGLVAPGTGAFPIHIVGTCSSSTCPSIRLDHLAFSGWYFTSYGSSSNTYDGQLMAVNDCFGVLDHITAIFTSRGEFMEIADSSYLGVGSYGDNSWAQPDDYGSANALYIEDSTFEQTNTSGPSMSLEDTTTSGLGGGRFVVRHNTLVNFHVYNHGTETGQRTRGGRMMEVYGNSFSCTTTFGCPDADTFRSGTGLFFDNNITASGGGYWNGAIVLGTYRRWAAATPWVTCDGQGSWDDNDGTVYYSGTAASTTTTTLNPGGAVVIVTDSGTPGWTTNQWAPAGGNYSIIDLTRGWGGEIYSNTSNTITYKAYTGISSLNVLQTLAAGDQYEILRASACLDAPGRGAGLLVENNSSGKPVLASTGAVGAVNEPVDPVYEWGDIQSNSRMSAWIGTSIADPSMIANRDWYSQTWPQQTAQTSPTSPFDGTSGTGWGISADRPTSCAPNSAGATIPGVAYWATDANNGNGELYVCEGTPGYGSWVAYYTPYTYPHPLTQTAPDPPANITVAVQ